MERQLKNHDWSTGADFTIAEITLAHALKEIRESSTGEWLVLIIMAGCLRYLRK